LKAGEFFYLPPGARGRVVDDEPYVSLHIARGENHAA
jgi:hypothetical protein